MRCRRGSAACAWSSRFRPAPQEARCFREQRLLRDDHYDVPLLAEHEISHIFRRAARRMLILGTGSSPAVVERFIYHDPADELFNGFYDEAPL